MSMMARALPAKLRSWVGTAICASGATGDRPVTGPIYAQLSVSDPCNHRCVMCPYHPPKDRVGPQSVDHFGGEQPGLMPVAELRRLVDELAALGTMQVELVGRGEPLLHPDIAAMVSYGAAAGLEVAVTTNASKLDGAMAASLVDAGLRRMKVSLNAGRAATYPAIHVTESPERWHRVVSQLRGLSELKSARRSPWPEVTLAFALSQPNYAELVDMVETVAAAGADGAWFQHVIVDERTDDLALDREALERLHSALIPAAKARAEGLGLQHNLDELAATPPPYGDGVHAPVPCYVGSYFTSVLGNGQVLPCCQCDDSLGDSREAGFAAVWRSEAYRRFRKAARSLPEQSAELSACQCDRCYFRPHNLAIHRALHPGAALSGPGVRLRQLMRFSRLDGAGGAP